MKHLLRTVRGAVAVLALALSPPAHATDVDGPDDCLRPISDFGDAPETAQAYPGVPAMFPTCIGAGPVGTMELACAPISTPPGPAGYVQHANSTVFPNYWLGCSPLLPPLGIDPESDGKTNDLGAAPSVCNQFQSVDCVEAAFGMQFGQDECYGTDDAGIGAWVTFVPCTQASITYTTYSCAPQPHSAYLNILVDWNQDGDWNDNFMCPGGICAYEWAIKNAPIAIMPGCIQQASPSFLTGPNPGRGWMRITITDEPVTDDYPWNGSASQMGERLFGGETEDYPVEIVEEHDPCPEYQEFGDAPEDIQAYVGVVGHFPTCTAVSAPGTQELACPPISSAPGPTGYMEHRRVLGSPWAFWLGCWMPGVDGEPDGKTNDTGGGRSACVQQLQIDCIEPWWLQFGQDECYADAVDAGIQAPITFTACTPASVTYDAFNCGTTDVEVYLNILVDWNHDGDWNDNFDCPNVGCAYEWAVKNVPILLVPGCQTLVSAQFLTGPYDGIGEGWLRISLTEKPVCDDYPWSGSACQPILYYEGGETEDYPVTIVAQPDPCPEYEDFGDAPENSDAYLGVKGRFPTCTFLSPPGTQEIACTPARSTPPGQTGHVRHVRNAGDPFAIWLGCGTPGVDGEPDGKINDHGGMNSDCNHSVPIDCIEPWWLQFGQDECYGDVVDAGIQAPIAFTSCTPATVTFDAFNCGQTAVDAYLNILVDWNHDGDWNDNFDCPGVGCAHEWAVKNVVIPLAPGCQTLTSPQFLAGPSGGAAPMEGWLRITITLVPVTDDFPWAGSIGMPGDVFKTGETEDYPVTIAPEDPCKPYQDFGDAPEEAAQAYLGVNGHFPTCTAASAPGTQELACPAISTAPGPTGYVEHLAVAGNPSAFWLGCNAPGVDGELDGKMNDTGANASTCNPAVLVDCAEAAFGLSFGQDECTADFTDSGINAPITFTTCTLSSVTFDAFNCRPGPVEVYLNILVDWNHDGDWNDNFLCPDGSCAYEWAVKNVTVLLPPGCLTLTSPSFLTGPAMSEGDGWLRITLSERPALDDYPWDGTASDPGGPFMAGETEDYPVHIEGGPCEIGYEDFGDAPEDIQAYTYAKLGRFPTCLHPSPKGTQEIQCGLPRSLPPGPTGFVRHVAQPYDPWHFWLGCGAVFPGGVDSEIDGKVEVFPMPPMASHCDPTVVPDCMELAFGVMPFAQDECIGDVVDAGVTGPFSFPRCATAQVNFQATNCGPIPIEVFLNILVDWNYDADWNDNILCPVFPGCAYEWAVKNIPIVLIPGCNPYVSPVFNTGPNGLGWMRVTLTAEPVPDDFPWNGSAGMAGEAFRGGETEDYPVVIPPLSSGDPDVPSSMWLAPTWPNPGRTSTLVRYALPREANVDLLVYDVSGRKVRTLASGIQPAGEHSVRWDYRTDDGGRAPAGLYLVALAAEGRVFTQRTIRIE